MYIISYNKNFFRYNFKKFPNDPDDVFLKVKLDNGEECIAGLFVNVFNSKVLDNSMIRLVKNNSVGRRRLSTWWEYKGSLRKNCHMYNVCKQLIEDRIREKAETNTKDQDTRFDYIIE